MLEFVTETTERLDKFIASKVDVSRSRVQRAIKDGQVTVNGKQAKENDFMLSSRDKVLLPEFGKEELKAYSLDLKVMFENKDFAVIDKPAGLVVHPGAGNKEETLANALLFRFPGIGKVGEPHRPGIVHRLDEDTSGLILIAKTMPGFEYFKQAFKDRKIEKEYLALVHKVPANKHGVIDAPLEKVPLKQKMKVGSGKAAVTEYWVLSSDPLDQYALFRVKLHTGRTHQIRAHLSHIGHPIVGDKVYGSKNDGMQRQFLHANRLKFQLQDETWLELESELPQDLKNFLDSIKIKF